LITLNHPIRLLGAALLLMLAGCRSASTTDPPTLDDLVGAHLEGDYERVLYWCPVYLEEPTVQPRLSDWCLYGLPAAMWLSFDTTRALGMLRAVCTDVPTGRLRGDEEFRMYYAGEVVRWFALPLRAQKREATLVRARDSMVEQISEVCGLDPGVVFLASEATLHKR
jgi:hypothetical protein